MMLSVTNIIIFLEQHDKHTPTDDVIWNVLKEMCHKYLDMIPSKLVHFSSPL